MYVQVKFLHDYNHGHMRHWKDDHFEIPLYQAEYLEHLKRVEIVGKPKFHLWKDGQNRDMDGESEMRLMLNGYTHKILETPEPVLADLKSDVNINPISSFESISEKLSWSYACGFIGGKLHTPEARAEAAYFARLHDTIKFQRQYTKPLQESFEQTQGRAAVPDTAPPPPPPAAVPKK